MFPARFSPRRGLSIVEAILLLLGLVLVVGLIVMGLGYAREQARQLQCENNLKEIGTAIHSFQKHKSFLPASRIAPGYATWAAQLGPFLPLKDEENPLVSWDMELPYYSQAESVRIAQVALYYCPARRPEPGVSVSGDYPRDGPPGPNVPGALGDYACAPGSSDSLWETADADGAIILGEVLEKKGQRIVRWRSRTSLTELPRGQGYTIMVGEKHVQLGTFGQRAEGDGALYNGDYPASSSRIGGPRCGLAQAPSDPFQNNFGSYHNRVCFFLFADGHVEKMSVDVSEEVLGRMLNRHAVGGP
jgi:prepilin-type processing-associated H-X9-DG protein